MKKVIKIPHTKIAYTAVKYEGAPRLAVVEQDVEGFTPVETAPFESMTEAEEAAAHQNSKLGFDEKQAVIIVASSMFPKKAKKGGK